MAVIRSAESERMARHAIVLDLGDLRRQAEALEARAKEQAETIIAEARRERERIVAGAADAGRAQGHAEGLARGLAEGREKGRLEALAQEAARARAVAEGWMRALDQFERSREDMLQEGRDQLVGLALEIASRVVKRAVEADAAAVAPQLEAALSLAVRASRLLVEVATEDEAVAKDVLPGAVQRLCAGANWSLVTSAGLDRGSVIVRTEGGEIDASIATQLDRIADSLLPGRDAKISTDSPTPPPTGANESAS